MTQEELNKALELHKMWLDHEEGGVMADISGASLMNTNLKYTNLTFADLRGADLRGADLTYTNLKGANLAFANIRGANLKGADLSLADLKYTNLKYTNLTYADLRNTDLRNADLSCADLRNSDLSGADLGNTNIEYSIIDSETKIDYLMACPSDGTFIGWKKVRGKLVKLEIPGDAKRCSATTKKCRCSKAKVLGIFNLDETESKLTEIINGNYCLTTYRIGEMVYPDSFDENRWCECSHGIHFFMDKQDAIAY